MCSLLKKGKWVYMAHAMWDHSQASTELLLGPLLVHLVACLIVCRVVINAKKWVYQFWKESL